MELVQMVVVVSILSLLLFLLSMIWPPDSPWSPWWRTTASVADSMLSLARVNKKDHLIDLGCGEGTVLIHAAKKYGATGLGVEIDPFRVCHARLNTFLSHVSAKVTIKRQNLFTTDLHQATVVVVYLVPKTLGRLEEKFRSQLKPGTRIISYMYQIPYLPLLVQDEKQKIYVYEMPGKKLKHRAE